MSNSPNFILFDSLKGIQTNGKFTGSIISKWDDKVIFSDNITVSDFEGISITDGLLVGFDKIEKKYKPFSQSRNFKWNLDENPIEYSILIPETTMEQYDQGSIFK